MSDIFSDLVEDAEIGEIAGGYTREEICGASVTSASLDRATKTCRCGHYHAIACGADSLDDCVIAALAHIVECYISRRDRLLVVGFGNSEYVCDALGARVLAGLDTSILDGHMVTLAPLVEAVTGLSSIEIVRSIVYTYRPTKILAIDTLATSHIERLGTCIQLTDAGISPGAGVSTKCDIVDSTTMGVPVIGVGVPLVIATRHVTTSPSAIRYLVPSTIDTIIGRMAGIMSRAIMRVMT